eukprot:2689730-Rhodomonas_salina.2
MAEYGCTLVLPARHRTKASVQQREGSRTKFFSVSTNKNPVYHTRSQYRTWRRQYRIRRSVRVGRQRVCTGGRAYGERQRPYYPRRLVPADTRSYQCSRAGGGGRRRERARASWRRSWRVGAGQLRRRSPAGCSLVQVYPNSVPELVQIYPDSVLGILRAGTNRAAGGSFKFASWYKRTLLGSVPGFA